jgi:RNA polymerase sigma-70 factor (ECF subfamily)
MTDEEVVELVQKGDKNKFGEIVERYQEKLFWYVKGVINQNNEEVEDVVQEVFLSSYENILSFDCNKKFSSWIYRIAHNKAIDTFRKKRVKKESIEDYDEFFGNDDKLLEELQIDKEKEESVEKAINKLELKYKEVVRLYYFDQKSYDEISDILRIPTGNVGVLLFRAKSILKKELKKYG